MGLQLIRSRKCPSRYTQKPETIPHLSPMILDPVRLAMKIRHHTPGVCLHTIPHPYCLAQSSRNHCSAGCWSSFPKAWKDRLAGVSTTYSRECGEACQQKQQHVGSWGLCLTIGTRAQRTIWQCSLNQSLGQTAGGVPAPSLLYRELPHLPL